MRDLPPPSVRRAIREQAGLSQQQLANQLGVNRSTVNRWESGARHPENPLLQEYARVLEELNGGWYG